MTATEVVRDFRTIRVLVIGDAMLDTYYEGSATRLCREGPVPVVRKTAEDHVPGGAANTAANVRALGADVMFLGLIGDDTPGSLLRTGLRERGVDDRWLVSDHQVSTLHKQRILSDEQYVVRFDSGETRSCSAAGHEQLLAHLDAVAGDCDLIVVSDYRYGVLSEAMIERLAWWRSSRACPMVVDSKDLQRFARAHATVVTPNHLEARLAVEPNAREDGSIDLDDFTRLARRLHELIDTEWVAITMAAAGVLLVDKTGQVEHVPAYPVSRANDVGAGDSFAAALALSLASGAEPIEAVRIGVAAGSIAVTQQRTAVVGQQELLQRVSREDTDGGPTPQLLAEMLEADRRRGRSIVFTNGVFDILHAGHIHFLRQARELGDLLVVGVNSDRSARRLKGKNRPINGQQDRLALVAALDAVDHAILFDEETPTDLITTLRPDIHVKGGDYQDRELPESEAVAQVGGRVVILPLSGDLSTTTVIDRILSLAREGDMEAVS